MLMNDLTKRHSEIVEIVSRRGYAAIEELAATFSVTPQTLRRDLQDLSDRGLLRRHHGGASANWSTTNADYELRHVETAGGKAAIGAAAADLVKPGTSLFLTPGTTVDAFAKAVAGRAPSGLRVVTTSTTAAGALQHCPGIVIHITGGLWMGHNRAVAGAAAAEAVQNFRCDLLVTSIGGVDQDGDLLEYKDDEAIVGRAMFRNARKRILLADHTKFTRVATCRIANVSELDVLVTDRPPPARILGKLQDSGCALIVAPERSRGRKAE
jgi:DeoR family glycerol-3-phosphate regulon repressor